MRLDAALALGVSIATRLEEARSCADQLAKTIAGLERAQRASDREIEAAQKLVDAAEREGVEL